MYMYLDYLNRTKKIDHTTTLDESSLANNALPPHITFKMQTPTNTTTVNKIWMLLHEPDKNVNYAGQYAKVDSVFFCTFNIETSRILEYIMLPNSTSIENQLGYGFVKNNNNIVSMFFLTTVKNKAFFSYLNKENINVENINNYVGNIIFI